MLFYLKDGAIFELKLCHGHVLPCLPVQPPPSWSKLSTLLQAELNYCYHLVGLLHVVDFAVSNGKLFGLTLSWQCFGFFYVAHKPTKLESQDKIIYVCFKCDSSENNLKVLK